VIIDRNKLQITGGTEEVNPIEPLNSKFESFGFCVKEVNGNNVASIEETLKELPLRKGSPNLIIANTTKGYGVSFIENQVAWHHKVPSEDEFKKAMGELDKKLEAYQ